MGGLYLGFSISIQDLNFSLVAKFSINPNLHGHRPFYLLVLFGLNFVSWTFIIFFQTFLEVKADINRVILTSCSTHLVLQKLPLGGSKDGFFSFFQRSCKLGLSQLNPFENSLSPLPRSVLQAEKDELCLDFLVRLYWVWNGFFGVFNISLG